MTRLLAELVTAQLITAELITAQLITAEHRAAQPTRTLSIETDPPSMPSTGKVTASLSLRSARM